MERERERKREKNRILISSVEPYLSWRAAPYHELIRKKQENMRKKKGRAAKQKRWEMKGWERMRKFAFLRMRGFTL